MDDRQDVLTSKSTCPRCGHPAVAALISCPFQVEVHNDPTPRCRCCDECVQRCIDSI